MKTLIVLGMAAIAPVCAYAVDGQILINQASVKTFPFTITASGSYKLSSNLNVAALGVVADGISIDADNVTLDLNGFAVIGNGGANTVGIENANNHNGITIKNGAVTGFSGGVGLSGARGDFELTDVHASNNSTVGISVHGASSVIRHCIADHNLTGFSLFEAVISDSGASFNSADGIDAKESSIIHNIVSENANVGVSADTLSLVSTNMLLANGTDLKGGLTLMDNSCSKGLC
jgi:hypothetical protein